MIVLKTNINIIFEQHLLLIAYILLYIPYKLESLILNLKSNP